MHFASLGTYGNSCQPEIYGSNWSLNRRSSCSAQQATSLLGPSLERNSLIGPKDPRYERAIDLVPDEHGNIKHRCDSGTCQRVFIRVSGQMFETQLGTLNRFPNTLLGNPAKRERYWSPDNKCYEFSKHSPTFNYVLYYYQSGGKLICPDDIPEDIFLDEVAFYELGQEVVDNYKVRAGFLPEPDLVLPETIWKRKIWLLLEYPTSSTKSRVIGVVSLAIIILSIVNFCLESIPAFEKTVCVNVTDSQYFDDYGKEVWQEVQSYSSPFFIIECMCALWFTIEVILRFLTCPYKKRFVFNLMNIFDIAAVIPFYVITAVIMVTGTCDHTKESSISIVFLRIMRLFRAFRIFKLTKHSRGMQILGLTIKESLKELSLFAIFLGIAVIFFSASIYYADLFDTRSENITSIPDAFWWAIVTMCTVGYGDKVPSGILGKLVGSICVVSGVITIALLVPVVVSNFSTYYSHEPSKTTRICIVNSKGNVRTEIVDNEQAHTQQHSSSTKNGCTIS
ncbi:potassium voltage-gated channel subfamily A member 2-like [Watersipora subatra]|uniref:potassium voltage-gated channel subfamily A member 2-like n=1 Tax=Watersipora subatra TaxID=2589382 RepID=UPI00355B51EC